MNAERWHGVKRLLQSALERPREERELYLQQECAGDDALRREVESLLAAHDQAGSFLDSEPSSVPAEKLKPGTILGSYEIVSLIGAGGMGEVYRARDSRIGREVAIKRLPESFGDEPDRLRRFEREARLAGSLNHPNLVTIHDVGSHDVPFVVMELLRGETLRGVLSGRPAGLPLRKAVEYAIQIATGLAAAHEQGIVHRDLKPENIFVTDDGGLKILDFGLAKVVQPPLADEATARRESDAATTKGVVLGTAAYMSPEQVSGETVDVRSDIFSFGLILYEMLSGLRPFKRESTIETMHAIVAEDAPELFRVRPSIPAFLDRIVRRCIEKKPGARFQSARDVAYALEALETPTGELWTSATPRKQRRVWVAIATAAIVIVAAAAAWVFTTQRPRPISFQRLTFRRGTVTQARFAPDGRTVVFGAAWDGDPVRIFVKRPEGDEIVPLDLPPADLLSVSRSGELAILLEPQRQLPWNPIGTLARASMNGGTPRRLVDNVLSADWSPDGSSIALVRDTGREQRLEIRSSEGGELQRQLFATSSGVLSHVRFSPAGDRIGFMVSPDRGSIRAAKVLVMNVNGTGERSVGSAVIFTDLAWSPDGREIWFAEGIPVQATIRAASMSGQSRTVFVSPGTTSFSDIAGGKILMIQNDVAARVSCLARGASAERDMSWRNWNFPLDITADGRQLLLNTSASRGTLSALKPLDGSPMTELTRAFAFTFAADQRSVLAAPNPQRSTELAFIPIGTGEKISLSPTKLDGISWAAAAPNGKTVIVAGVTKNATHLYEKSIAGGQMRRISDEPIYYPFLAVSPGSDLVAAVGPTSRVTVYSVVDGKASVIPTSVPGDYPIRFAADGSLLYSRCLRIPNVVYRFDFHTQRATAVREVAPADRAGVLYAYAHAMTADAQCYCYQYVQVLSKLFVADGVDRRARLFQ